MNEIQLVLARGSVGLLLGGLVACQSGPSAAELQQLQTLEATLRVCNARMTHRNDAYVGDIERNVACNHMQSRDVEVLRAAQEIQARAQVEVYYLHQLRRRLLAGDPAETQLADLEPVAELLPGTGGAVDTLQRRLNAYARYVQHYLPAQDALLAADARHDPASAKPWVKIWTIGASRSFISGMFQSPRPWQHWPGRKPKCCSWSGKC